MDPTFPYVTNAEEVTIQYVRASKLSSRQMDKLFFANARSLFGRLIEPS